MGKPIAIVNKMAESVFTQEAQSASSLTQATFPALLQEKFTTGRKNKVRAPFGKTGDGRQLVPNLFATP